MTNSFKYSDFEFCGALDGENSKCYFVDDGKNTVTIPKSQVRRMRKAAGGGNDWILIIPYWLAQERGIV